MRLVASLISVIGILHPRKTMHLFPSLFAALDRRTGDSPKSDFKSAQTIQKLLASYSHEKREQDLEYARKGKFLIKFVGLFDTVSALARSYRGARTCLTYEVNLQVETRGRPSTLRRSPSQEPPAIKFDSFGFDETRLETCIEHAVQALALDEFRVDYVPVLWVSNPLGRPKGQTLEQVWFSGAHADVGGGYMDGDLGYVSLWWMCSKVESMLEIDMDFLRDKMCQETVEAYGKMPPHKSRVGQFLLAKSVERPVPLTANPYVFEVPLFRGTQKSVSLTTMLRRSSTNELVHASVNYQPPSQLRAVVSALFSNPDLFTKLSPLEQQLRDHWPTPEFSIRSKKGKKRRSDDKEKKSLSDTEVDGKDTRPDHSTRSPPPSPTLTSLSDDEKSRSEFDHTKGVLSSASSLLADPPNGQTPPEGDWYDVNFDAQNFRETSQRLFPNTNEQHHLLPRLSNPFKAIHRRFDGLVERWDRRQERKEEAEEWKEMEKQMNRERRSSRD